MRTRFSDWMQKMVGQKQARQDYGELHVQGQTAQLPARPNSTVLNHSIPLFFIGRNRSGFWVAREAAGPCGGLFLFRRSAARFARKKSSPRGSAIMLVERTINSTFPLRATSLLSRSRQQLTG
jgi:hypothetical protein